MEICLEILQLKGDEFAGALKAASTVEIISKIQHLEMLITSSFKEGRPLYHPMRIDAEVTQGMCELQIALIEELKRRQAKKEPGFASQVCAALKPLVITTVLGSSGKLSPSAIPKSYEVQPLKPGQQAKDKATCNTCGLSWDDGVSTSMTPAPSARCPFEAFHKAEASAATMVTALVGKCGEYAKPGKEWCIFKHDSKNPKKRAEKQPKGWPKHYSTKEEAQKGLQNMHVFSSAVEHGSIIKEWDAHGSHCMVYKDSSGLFGAVVRFPDGKERSNGMDFRDQKKAEEYANQAAKNGPGKAAAASNICENCGEEVTEDDIDNENAHDTNEGRYPASHVVCPCDKKAHSARDEDKLWGTVHKGKFWYVQDEQGRKFELKELDDAGKYLDYKDKSVLFHINENDEACDLEPA
jgi:hypothetical protein